MPGWVAPCNWIMFMIVIIYFIWFGIQNGGGVPDVKDGQFVIVDHGRILKILTQQQYDKAREQELRMLATWVFSAYFGLMMYWRFHQKDINAKGADTQ